MDGTSKNSIKDSKPQIRDEFREIFNQSPIGIIFHNKEGIAVNANDSAFKIMAVSKLDDILGINLFDNPFIEEKKEELTNNGIIRFQAPLDLDMIKDFGFYYPTKNGVLFLDYTVSVTDSGFLVQIQDISERKQVEDALKESEEKFAKAFQSNSAAMTITRLSDGLIIDANESFERLFGYTYGETVGHSTNDLGIWLNTQERDAEVKRLLRRGKLPEHEVTFGTKSGAHINVVFSVELISIGGQRFILSTVMDITERKKAEEALLMANEQSELERKRLETILETTPSGVIIVEASGKVSYINKRAKQLYGIDITSLDLADAISKVKARRADGLEYPVGEGPSGRALKGQVVHSEEMIMERADGTVIPIFGSAAPILDSEGKVIAAVAIFDDITERKKVEEHIKSLLEETQQLNEELEVSNEELQSTTEEIQVANEELQDTTEELRQKKDELLVANIDLQENRALLYSIIEGTSDPIYVKDLKGRYILFNSAAEVATGKKSDEVLGNDDTFLFPHDEAKAVMDGDRKIMDEEKQMTYEETVTAASGDKITYLSIKGPLMDDNDHVRGLFGIARDITGRKKDEEALMGSEEKFRSLYSSIIEGVAIHEVLYDSSHEAVDYVITDVNPAYENITGLKRSEVIGMKASELYGTGKPPYMDIYVQVAESGEPAHFETYFEPMDKHFQIAVTSPDNGKFATFFEDITERNLAKEALKESESQFQVLIHNLVSGVALVDETGRFALVNPSFLQMFGLDNEMDILNVNSQDWSRWNVYGEDGKLLHVDEHPVRKVALTGKPVKNQLVGVRNPSEKELTWMLVSAEPMLNKDDIISMIICTYYDITELKQMQEKLSKSHDNLEQKVEERTVEIEEAYQAVKENEFKLKDAIRELERSNKELQSFAYITSHDLQEPLRTMGSYAGLLKHRYGGQLDSDADDFLDFMVSGATRLQGMIKGLLDYSRVGTRGGVFKDFSADEALDAALTNLKSPIEECHVEVLSDSLPVIHGDESQISRVFQNLIGNALKFRKEGVQPKIHIKARKEGYEYIFSVQDNGIGIEPQYSDRIFEVFKRLHAIGEYDGTGIGLAIVKRIIERHHGRIWVESDLGEGSTFYFTIPVEPVEN